MPQPHLKMEAVNTRYLLKWNYSTDISANFTAQMTYSNEQHIEDSYTNMCLGVETHCDYSNCLNYNAEYILRVRAEARGQRSDWARLKFCPEEDASLGAPSELWVEAGVSMVTVSFKEPMAEDGRRMSSLLSPMAFRLQFWTDDAPSQEKQLDSPLHTLPLKAHTRYCVRVQAFSDAFDKDSPYTPPQCTTTLGPTQVWPILLPLLVLLVLLGVLCFVWTRNWRRRSRMLERKPLPRAWCNNFLPSTLCTQLHSKSHQLLLVPQKTTCVICSIVAKPTAEEVSPSLDTPTAPGPETDGCSR
ncbi:hypothetical protein CRUP_008944 [Coryphaenoides rupestris]|nr:hypothetical protein CRUP_008944 [Coryphaenoides rupestris]